jgi:O-antigen ligase
MSFRDKILFISIILFTGILFFPSLQVMNFLVTALLVIVTLFYNSFKEKLQLLKQRRYLLWELAFFILILVSLSLSSNKHSGFRYLDSRLPLFYFPLSIGLIHLKKDFRDKILLGIAAVITIAAIACFNYGIYRTITLHNTAYLYNDALTIPVTGHQSIYISLLVNIAIYIFAYFLLYQPAGKYKPLLVLIILLLFVISFLLASRNLMLVLYASTIIFALFYVFKRKKYLEGITLIMGLLIGVFLIFKFFPKTINRFKELGYTQFNYQGTGPESHYNMQVTGDQWNGANFRIAAWKCGWEMFLQNPIIGVDIGDKKDRLMEVYRSKNFQFAIKTGKNLHNNYLDILVSTGIIGLALFLTGWFIYPFIISLRHRDGLASLIILTFAFAMVTEVYFDRSLGGMLVGFFIPFLLTDKKKDRRS